MSRRKNISGVAVTSPFLAGEVQPGQVVDTPDRQPDGSPLIWPPEFWEDADTKPSVRRGSEGEQS